MPKDPRIKKVLVIGSGPIIIGQAAEFDYSGTQACRALKAEGIETVLLNSNPATIMTDPDVADHVYIEPMTLEVVERILDIEKPDSVLPNLGGQMGLNLSMELAYTAGKNFFEGLLGKEGACYVPYLMTVAIYIAFSNLIGVFGVKPPTKDLDVTAALALMSIVLIEGAGIRARGGIGFLKSLSAPTPIMTPMNILEIAIRPTSLCMRLFGNVLGAFVIMELIKLVVPVFVPAVFSLYFDLFDGLIQTYVFVFLTSLFMKETMGGED